MIQYEQGSFNATPNDPYLAFLGRISPEKRPDRAISIGRCGSVSEIVDEGKTGFIVDSEDEAVRAVLELDQLDRRTVRRVFQERFTADVMARNYLRLYWRLCGAAGTANVTRRILADVH